MASGGGKPKQQTYDPSVKDAEMQKAKTDIMTDTKVRAYDAAKSADHYRDMNVKFLRDGLGFMSNLMETQIKNQEVQSNQATLKNTEDIEKIYQSTVAQNNNNKEALIGMQQNFGKGGVDGALSRLQSLRNSMVKFD